MDEVIPGTTFAGVYMAQTWKDLQLYEKVLNAHPELNSVVELGTGQGGLSHFLHAQAQARNVSFHTFDSIPPDADIPGWEKVDVFQDVDLVVSHFTRPVLLVCDDGNKVLELETYAPHLYTGDLAAVHDWGTEVNETNVPHCMSMIHEGWCESMTRFFRVLQKRQM
jgi:cephalosporin hydroxylase